MERERGKSYIASIGEALASLKVSQREALEFIRKNYARRLDKKSLAIIERVFSHSSITNRYFALDSLERLLVENPDERIERFTSQAVNLAKEASIAALDKAGIGVDQVTDLVINTCTGYICPGLSTYLIEKMNLSPKIRAFDLIGCGCSGAVANLQMSEALSRDREEGAVLSVAVEICSATYQMDSDPGLIISNAIFSDGAAAAVLWRHPQGLELGPSISRFQPCQRDHIRYIYKDGLLHNQITAYVPQLAAESSARAVRDLLALEGKNIEDINHWAIHPGGNKVIEAVKKSLDLPEDKLNATRRILSEYGNMSSPTVWFVLRSILERGVNEGDLCAMISYGAGFSLHACLLKQV